MRNTLDILVLPPAQPGVGVWRKRGSLIARTGRQFSKELLAEAGDLLNRGCVTQVTLGRDFIEARVDEARACTAVWHVLDDDLLLECDCDRSPCCRHLAVLLLVLEEHLRRRSRGDNARAPELDTARATESVPSRSNQDLASLCLILDPWKPSVRFLREDQPARYSSGGPLNVESLTLGQVACWSQDSEGASGKDRGLLDYLKGLALTWPRATLGDKQWCPTLAEFSELLPVLADHPRVFDHHGRSLQVELCLGQPQVRLTIDRGDLCAQVTIQENPDSPDASAPLQWCVRGEGYCWNDPRALQEIEGEIMSAGFVPEPEAARFRLPARYLDHWVGHQLPRWRRQGRTIQLDPSVRSLLEGATRIRTRFFIADAEDIDWFEVRWQLQAGEEILSGRDLRTLRVFPGRYLRLESGRTVSVERGLIRRQLDELSGLGYSPAKPEPLRLPLRFLPRMVDLAGTASSQDLQLAPRLRDLYRCLKSESAYPSIPSPDCLQTILRSYQLDGFRFLHFLVEHDLGGILADDMGLGKTIQTLALILHLRESRGPRPSLVVCPTSVAPNWLEEAEKFVPQLRRIQLRERSQIQGTDLDRYDLVVTSYGLVPRHPIGVRFRCVILDEAQNIKNPRAQRTRAVKKLEADFKLALTGTPVENNVTELWSLFDFLLPGLLGSATQFQKSYARPIMRDRDSQALRRLTETVGPFILRRLKSEVVPELPDKVEQNVYCDLSPRQRRLYREVAERVRGDVHRRIEADGIGRCRIPILTALMRLRQLCCHPALIDPQLESAGSAKLDAFLEQLDTILSGEHRVIVFSQFVAMLRILEAQLRLRKIPYLYLDGATTDRSQAVRRFQRGREHDVFLMSLKAGGAGLNLTAADYVILYDPWWNPAVEQQAIDRIYRIGQDKPVTAYRMITRDTVEEKMLKLHRRKQSLAESLLESRLDEEDLLGLLSE